MAKHIKWTDDEWDLLARRITNYLISNPGITLPGAYEAVSHSLGEGRIRSMKATTAFEPIIDRIKQLMKEKKKAPEQPELPPKVQIVDRFIPKSLTEFSTEELQSEIYRRQFEPLLKEMVGSVTEKMSNQLNILFSNLVNEEESDNEERKVLPRILVVGLMPKQEEEVSREYGEFYDFKFHKDKAIGNLGNVAKKCDRVILMTKFVSHNHQNMIKNAGVELLYCNGSVSELKNLLEKLFV